MVMILTLQRFLGAIYWGLSISEQKSLQNDHYLILMMTQLNYVPLYLHYVANTHLVRLIMS